MYIRNERLAQAVVYKARAKRLNQVGMFVRNEHNEKEITTLTVNVLRL